MVILDGRKLSEKILNNLKKEIKNRRLKLKLAAVLVGNSGVSSIYIKKKEKACKEIGIDFKLFHFPEKIKTQELKKEIEKINKDKTVSGIIVQLPLPKQINTQEVLNIIPSEKDIDVLSETSIGKFAQRDLPILPPVVSGVCHFLKEYKIEIMGKNILIMGAGRLVGYPLAIWLLQQNATVSVLNKYTENISQFTKKADILISGVGKPNLIRGNMIKGGVVIIDAGTSVEGGKLSGDINFKETSKRASYITPVPGGVGPMTVACLLENLVRLKEKR